MPGKWRIDEITVGSTMETTFWANPVEGSGYRFRATHLDGKRAPKVVLCDDPRKLPRDHKDRYAMIEEKLQSGDALEVAAAVRDMAWRRKQEGKFTTRGKRFYEEAMMLLAGEIAAVQDIEVKDAAGQVNERLQERLTPVPAP